MSNSNTPQHNIAEEKADDAVQEAQKNTNIRNVTKKSSKAGFSLERADSKGNLQVGATAAPARSRATTVMGKQTANNAILKNPYEKATVRRLNGILCVMIPPPNFQATPRPAPKMIPVPHNILRKSKLLIEPTGNKRPNLRMNIVFTDDGTNATKPDKKLGEGPKFYSQRKKDIDKDVKPEIKPITNQSPFVISNNAGVVELRINEQSLEKLENQSFNVSEWGKNLENDIDDKLFQVREKRNEKEDFSRLDHIRRIKMPTLLQKPSQAKTFLKPESSLSTKGQIGANLKVGLNSREPSSRNLRMGLNSREPSTLNLRSGFSSRAVSSTNLRMTNSRNAEVNQLYQETIPNILEYIEKTSHLTKLYKAKMQEKSDIIAKLTSRLENLKASDKTDWSLSDLSGKKNIESVDLHDGIKLGRPDENIDLQKMTEREDELTSELKRSKAEHEDLKNELKFLLEEIGMYKVHQNKIQDNSKKLLADIQKSILYLKKMKWQIPEQQRITEIEGYLKSM